MPTTTPAFFSLEGHLHAAVPGMAAANIQFLSSDGMPMRTPVAESSPLSYPPPRGVIDCPSGVATIADSWPSLFPREGGGGADRLIPKETHQCHIAQDHNCET